MADFIIWTCTAYYADLATRSVGAYQIASWLSQHGYNVKVIDFCHLLSTQQLTELTKKYIGPNTIGVGVSTTFWKKVEETTQSKKISNLYSEPEWVINARLEIENKFPKLDWVLGGGNAGFFKLNKFKWNILTGYCENQILKFLNEKTQKTNFSSFDIQFLNPAFNYENSIQKDEVLPIELSRGCQFECNFCRFELIGKRKNTYIRNLSHVEYELRENYEKFGTTRYVVIDDTVNESTEKIRGLAEIAQRLPFKLEWIGYNRLDLIGSHPETLHILKDSGLKSAYFGIESFHPHGSKIAGKPWLGKKGKDFLLELKESWGNEVSFFLSFIVGLGEERLDDVYATNQWCIENNIPDWHWHALHISKSNNMLHPSKFDKNYQQYGYNFPKDDDNYWENNLWNFNEALDAAKKLNVIGNNYGKPAAFFLSALASTTGEGFDTLMNVRRADIDWTKVHETKTSFLDRYYNLMINN